MDLAKTDIRPENKLQKTKREDVKRYLKSYLALELVINRRMDEVEHLHMTLNRMVVVFSDMPKSPGKPFKFDAALVKMLDLEQEIKQDIEQLVDLRQEIYDFVHQLEDEALRTILVYHYLNGLTWEEVAEKMVYSYQWVHKLHARALSLLAEKRR